jgi:hypothetical protein
VLGFGGAVALIVSLLSRDGKRVGDYLAGTVVIRERVPDAGTAVVIQMPPPLAQWASQLDLSGLPNDLALAIRQYLGRMGELRPEAGEALGHSLAAQVGACIGAPIPPGVPTWAYLSAVLAERRSRDHVRTFGQPVAQAAVTWPQQTYLHPSPQPPTEPPPDNPFSPPS